MFKTLAWLIIIVVIVAVGYVGFHAASAYRTIVVESDHTWFAGLCLFHCNKANSSVEDPNPIPTADPARLNVLVLGIRGEDDIANGGLLTDTMLVISVDRATKKAVMVSIPRDLYIDMTGKLADGNDIKLKGKINEVYVHGLEHQQGLTLTSQIVSRITGIHIDRAVLFDFAAFGKIVDTLGGIDITLKEPFSEPKQWVNGFSLPAGTNHLNGDQALYYARSRYSSSDFDRARRQQQVILAIKAKAVSLGFLSNPTKVSGLFDSLKGNVKTNFQPWEINDIITVANSLKDNSIQHAVLSTENLLYETHTPSGEYILLPRDDNYTAIRNYFKLIFEHPTPSYSPKPTTT